MYLSRAGRKSLKMMHNYYYQMQIAMLCTNTQWCDFFLRTTIDVHCERISLGLRMCCSILPKLREFYFCAILPELTLPRNPEIHEPKEWLQDKEAWLHRIRTQLYNHINFFTYSYVHICLITPKIYLLVSPPSEPECRRVKGVQNFFVHVILIYGRKGYPVTLTGYAVTFYCF